MRIFARIIIAALAICAVLTSCSSTYLGRMASLRGPDVDDYRKLPSRIIPSVAASTALAEEFKPDWPAQHPFIAVDRIGSSQALDAFLSSNATTAFIMLQDGKVVDERYYANYRRDSLFKSFSISKSVLSALFGIAQQKGYISSVDVVSDHLAETRGTPIGNLRLEHLFDNVSGFEYQRGFAPWKQQPQMYYTTDVRRYVLSASFAHKPGTYFEAEDLSPLLLGVVLEAAIRKKDPNITLSAFATNELWQPMGANYPALWVTDRADGGMEKTESGFTARALDLARFGQLYLNGGRSDKLSVVPESWVKASTRAPEKGAANLFSEGYYQNLWWGYFRQGRKQQDFYANGHFGQRIYVSPDKKLVLVRMGYDNGGQDWTEILARIADAWPSPQID
jgi:CubicO group peptidase (beta-lactamase class C family)